MILLSLTFQTISDVPSFIPFGIFALNSLHIRMQLKRLSGIKNMTNSDQRLSKKTLINIYLTYFSVYKKHFLLEEFVFVLYIESKNNYSIEIRLLKQIGFIIVLYCFLKQ